MLGLRSQLDDASSGFILWLNPVAFPSETRAEQQFSSVAALWQPRPTAPAACFPVRIATAIKAKRAEEEGALTCPSLSLELSERRAFDVARTWSEAGAAS